MTVLRMLEDEGAGDCVMARRLRLRLLAVELHDEINDEKETE